jgi:phage regulator Rha-like protein
MSYRVAMRCAFGFTAVFMSALLLSVHAQSRHSLTPVQRRLIQKELALEERVANARLMYTDAHPKLSALREQLRAVNRLLPHTPTVRSALLAQKRAASQKKKVELEEQLANARLVYRDTHPKVRSLLSQLKAVQTLGE